MSYEVFAQKWRPQLFREVVGQTHVTQTLQNQIKSDRLGHAYLFWGPRGTGKTTVARLFAKAINCLKPTQETEFDQTVTGEPCNECDACKQITQGSSFDVIEMDAASNRGIDTIRDLRENVKLSPASYKYKVYIIDEVHMLTQEGFNALLKTLEEPPGHVMFIMATTEHTKIPKTIVSRCQDFDFRYLSSEEIVERLQLIAADEDITANNQVLALIARQSEGCLRDAENLLERLVSSGRKELTLENVEETLGLGSSFLLNELAESIINQNLIAGLETLNKLSRQGMDLILCLNQLISYFRDLRLLAIDSQLDDLIHSSSSELPHLREKAENISVDRLSRIIKFLMHANREIKEYGYVQLQLESALVQINTIKEGIQLEEIVDKLIAIEQKIGSAEPNAESPSNTGYFDTDVRKTLSQEIAEQPSLQTQETPVTVKHESSPQEIETEPTPPKPIPETRQTDRSSDDLQVVWEEVKSKLPKFLSLGLFQNSVPSFDGEDRIKIACPQGSLSLVDSETKQKLTLIFCEALGKQVQVDLVKEEVVPQAEESDQTSDVEVKTTPTMRKRQAEEDEQIRPVLEMFDASILETK